LRIDDTASSAIKCVNEQISITRPGEQRESMCAGARIELAMVEHVSAMRTPVLSGSDGQKNKTVTE
jgi:hypothetical protein